MNITFTWPDYLMFIAIQNDSEFLIDMFINSLLIENDESRHRVITRIIMDLMYQDKPIWRWELPQLALSSHIEAGSEIMHVSQSKRHSIVGPHLAPRIHKLSRTASLEPSQQALLIRFPIRFTSHYIPDKLVVRIYSGKNLLGRNQIVIRAEPQDSSILFPVKGTWQVINNYDYTFSHRKSACHEFAIDLIQVSQDGSIFQKDTGFQCFGSPVFAVSDGLVIEKVDDILDNEVAFPTDQEPFRSEMNDNVSQFYGNYILIRHTSERCSFYAHLAHKSIDATVGQSVSAGEQIGRVGFSGDIPFSLLHFHITDTPESPVKRTYPLRFSNLVNTRNKPIDFIQHNLSIVHTL